ncbi:MAG: hypothetical protein WD885_00830 [Candidatus Saccharimonadales bacterium]
MSNRDAEFWRIVEFDSLYGERVVQASFDERIVAVSRYILFGEGNIRTTDFFQLIKNVAKDYGIDKDAAVEAMDISEARQITELLNG